MIVTNSPGPVQIAFKVTEISTASVIIVLCTMQVRLTTDPMGWTGLGVLLVSVTEIGAGTAFDKNFRYKILN